MKAQLRTPSPSRRTAHSVAGLVAVFAALGMALGSCAIQPPSHGLTPFPVQPESSPTAQPTRATEAATEISPNLRPMRERKFWEVIDRSREASAGDSEQQASAMEAVLATMKPAEIASFNATFIEKNNELYTWELWGAVYVLYEGCSDDCFDYFRSWVVGQGRDYYNAVQRDPLVLGDGRLTYASQSDDAEWFHYAAEDAYRRANGGDLYEDYPQTPSTLLGTEPSGTPWDEDKVEALYPELAPLP
ncbi:DUF4240 domain-containing protein [Paeniglutamicibacter sp. R2-26]|uniref:DUF4240 domain-containing protein n=1 Tax=Paeniglutamicibacter sp. R2-26 TaxID=3144417 RepID=UPI003EE70E42